jgi:hypothetical protein
LLSCEGSISGNDVMVRKGGLHRLMLALGLGAMLALSSPAMAVARGPLQCVPYARSVSGVDIHGNADGWWAKAQDRYDRGEEPRVGAVLAFRATSAMPHGHVAVVKRILDERHVLLDHANWSGPGKIERKALAQDVSEAGDWSEVRVWYGPSQSLGLRTNPAYGFIYNDEAGGTGGGAPTFAGGGGVIAAAP